jgi:plasmid stabilization system protein ParE
VRLRFTDLANQEIVAATSYYEEHREALGDRFERAVDVAVEVIAQSPERYRAYWKNHRRVFLRDFPYFLVYRFDGVEVVVAGCIHSSRSPTTWKKRDLG